MCTRAFMHDAPGDRRSSWEPTFGRTTDSSVDLPIELRYAGERRVLVPVMDFPGGAVPYVLRHFVADSDDAVALFGEPKRITEVWVETLYRRPEAVPAFALRFALEVPLEAHECSAVEQLLDFAAELNRGRAGGAALN